MTIVAPQRGLRVPIPVKILTVGTIALVMLTVAILLSANALVKAIAYKEIAKEVQVAQGTLWYLVDERGSAKIDAAGDLRFGSWHVKGDHSVVDRVTSLTGADATIFQVRDGRPMRLTTTIRKLNSNERNDYTELTGPA